MPGKNPFHVIYVVVARADDGYCFIAACMDEEAALDLPDAWDAMKEEQAKLHGADNIRTAKLKTKLGWMEPLFNIPSVDADVVEKVEHRAKVSGCSVCPFKTNVMGMLHCTHPGVAHRSDTHLIFGSVVGGRPEWCPLSVSPVVVELER